MNSSNLLLDIKLIYDYSNNNPTLLENMNNLFKEKITMNFLTNVVKNEVLATHYYNSNSKKYLGLDYAISNTKRYDNILIYFDELNAYALFDNVQQYEIFLSNLKENLREIINFSPYQILLAEVRQKVIILVKGNEEIAKDVAKYAKTYFNNDIILNTDLFTKIITVNLYVLNLNDAINKFKQFYRYLYEIDKQLTDYITSPIENMANGIKFIS